MEAKSQKTISAALGKFSSLLIKEKVINPENDESVLYAALGSVAQNYSQNSFSRPKSPLMTSVDFVKGPLATMMAKHEKSQSKIEELRKKKYMEEVSRLKQKPTINNDSKNLVKNIPPLHLRTEKILKEKKKKLEDQKSSRDQKEEQEISQFCTFKPKSRDSSRSRSPANVTQELYKWNENKKKTLEHKRKEQDNKETVLNKPVIDNFSSKLSKMVRNIQRCITPVHERLSKMAPKQVKKEEYSFKPQMAPKSREIVRKSRGGTPLTSRASSRASSVESKNSRNSSRGSPKVGYKINTCIGVIEKQNGFVNHLQVNESNRDFLNRLHKLKTG